MRQRLELANLEVVDRELAQILRSKSAAEKVAMICAANRTARILAAAGVRHLHPGWTEQQVQQEVIRRVCRGAS
ncbi:MAG: hypothetical protein IT425_12760 [Pirellulales bacterium]|nr:hypothetical protein [Pirellulales bacterium]